MPTEPEKDILDRERMIAAAKPIIDFASPMLQEIVNYSTQVLAKLLNEVKGGDELVAIHVPYLHLIEMIDAFEVQISQAVVEPATVSLRSAFECWLTISYILENDKDFLNRSLSYMLEDIHYRIRVYNQLDPDSPQGKEFRKAQASDKIGSLAVFPSVPDIKTRIKRLEELLSKPPYDALELEFIETKKRMNRKPHWYGLFGGPENLERLCAHLNLSGCYELLYRNWSLLTHGQGVYGKLIKSEDGFPALIGLRSTSSIKSLIQIGAAICLECTRAIIEKFLPAERNSYADWYMTEIRDNYRKL